jgi:hypothetical protein
MTARKILGLTAAALAGAAALISATWAFQPTSDARLGDGWRCHSMAVYTSCTRVGRAEPTRPDRIPLALLRV